eukprot:1329507-Amphidinium_carterae.1
MEKIPRVSTVIMSIEGEERCIALHLRMKSLNSLKACLGVNTPVASLMWGRSGLGWGAGEIREMSGLGVGQVIHRSEIPTGGRVWTGRWCHRKKNGGVRSRYVVLQYKGEIDTDLFSGTLGLEALRILLGIATAYNHAAICADFSTAFMYTSMVGEEVYIEQFEPPREAILDHDYVWKLKKALNGLKSARACPTLLYHPDSNVRISIHVDDPLGVGRHVNVMDVFRHLQQQLEVRVGVAMGAAELLYARQLLMDVGIKFDTPKLCTNATVAKSLAARQALTRIRHLEVRYLWLQDLTEQKNLTVPKVPGTSNPADMGTKHLAVSMTHRHPYLTADMCSQGYSFRVKITSYLS